MSEPQRGLDLEAGLALPPLARFRALWRDPDPLERGRARAFDRAKLLARLRKWKPDVWSTSPRAWSKRLPPAMSRQEACFWLRALREFERARWTGTSAAAVADQLEALPDWSLTPLEAAELWPPTKDPHGFWPLRGHSEPRLRVLPHLLEPIALLRLIRERLDALGAWSGAGIPAGLVELLTAYGALALPYLSRSERAELRAELGEFPPEPALHFHGYGVSLPPARFCFAALLGHQEAARQVISAWSPGALAPYSRQDASGASVFLGGLGGLAECLAAAERLEFYPESEPALLTWLANTGLAGLERVRGALLRAEAPSELQRVLLHVGAPRLVADLLAVRAAQPKQAKAVARWAKEHPRAWVEGSLRALAGEQGPAARDELIDLARAEPELLRELLAEEGLEDELRAEGQAILRESAGGAELSSELPEPLRGAFAAVQELGKAKAAARAPWLRARALRPLAVGGQELSEAASEALLRALYEAPLGAPPASEAERVAQALLDELRQRAPEEAREAFAWQLYELWERNDTPSKQKWLLHALAHFGGEGTVARLTPLIRKWPGESQHQRAVLGLDLLRAIGSDAALGAIAGIAQKLKYRALKRRAAECLEQIALARGLSSDELADRLVPECGLDAAGQRSFDYGPRQFAFVLSPELTPLVRDGSGKLRKAPPKPGKSDDEALAPAALKEWRAFRKQVKEALAVQVQRLEQAMVSGRRWTPGDFEALLRGHPLLRHVAPSLLWAAYGEGGSPRPFRITPAGLLDAAGAPLELGQEQRVGVIHALELEPAARAAWDERWDELGLLAPFPQLDREVLAPSASELAGDSLRELAGADTSPSQLRGSLIRAGWTRGAAQDAGLVCEHLKYFSSADLTALALHEGLSVTGGDERWNPFARLERCLFLRGRHDPDDVAWFEGEGVPLGEVPALVLSEVLRDMQTIARRAEG